MLIHATLQWSNKEKSSGGLHRGAKSAETSTQCITWGWSTTAVGENPPVNPVIRALLHYIPNNARDESY